MNKDLSMLDTAVAIAFNTKHSVGLITVTILLKTTNQCLQPMPSESSGCEGRDHGKTALPSHMRSLFIALTIAHGQPTVISASAARCTYMVKHTWHTADQDKPPEFRKEVER